NDASKKAKHDAKQPAPSSATSPASSTGYSNTDRHWRLDRHRSITGPVDSSVTCSSRTLSRGAKAVHTASPTPLTCVEQDASGRDHGTRRARRDPRGGRV